jgi:hypothetical protein
MPAEEARDMPPTPSAKPPGVVEWLETLAPAHCKEFRIHAELARRVGHLRGFNRIERLAFSLPVSSVPPPRPQPLLMPILSDGRPDALIPTAALNVYDAVVVVIWALLLFLVARCSKSGLTRDLFGLVVAVAALTAS